MNLLRADNTRLEKARKGLLRFRIPSSSLTVITPSYNELIVMGINAFMHPNSQIHKH
jgi:hypothetical protein